MHPAAEVRKVHLDPLFRIFDPFQDFFCDATQVGILAQVSVHIPNTRC